MVRDKVETNFLAVSESRTERLAPVQVSWICLSVHGLLTFVRHCDCNVRVREISNDFMSFLLGKKSLVPPEVGSQFVVATMALKSESLRHVQV